MSPKRVENTKIITDFSLQKDEFSDYDEAAILELSSLLGIHTETLIFYLVILRNYDMVMEEGDFTSRLRARFQGIKSNQTVLESIEDILHNLGLDSFSSKAWNYVTSKCSLEDNHLDIIDWAVLYLQDLIRYSLFPENVFGKFPYQELVVDSWFSQEKAKKKEGEGYEKVNILNRTVKKQKQNEPAYPLLDGKAFPEGIEEEGYKLFYHGTNHDSAGYILKEGITLDLGGKNLDFSHGNGFYLNDNFENSLLWAFKKNRKDRAVLIFKIPKQVLDDYRETSFNLFDDTKEWKRITNKFRNYQTMSKKEKKKFKKEMKGTSFIEGPMASVSKSKVGRAGIVKINEPIEGSYQMCLLSDDLVKKFDLYLHSIVFVP